MLAPAKKKQLVLIGGGHAHIQVLKRFAMKPLSDMAITLISDRDVGIYSGMVPGLIAGSYQAEELQIDLVPLAALAVWFAYIRIASVRPVRNLTYMSMSWPCWLEERTSRYNSAPSPTLQCSKVRASLNSQPAKIRRCCSAGMLKFRKLHVFTSNTVLIHDTVTLIGSVEFGRLR